MCGNTSFLPCDLDRACLQSLISVPHFTNLIFKVHCSAASFVRLCFVCVFELCVIEPWADWVLIRLYFELCAGCVQAVCVWDGWLWPIMICVFLVICVWTLCLPCLTYVQWNCVYSWAVCVWRLSELFVLELCAVCLWCMCWLFLSCTECRWGVCD